MMFILESRDLLGKLSLKCIDNMTAYTTHEAARELDIYFYDDSLEVILSLRCNMIYVGNNISNMMFLMNYAVTHKLKFYIIVPTSIAQRRCTVN